MSNHAHYSGVSTEHKWYWDPHHVQIAVGRAPNHCARPHKASRCGFKPVQKSPAELRCDDMIRVHNAEVKRNREVEAHLQEKLDTGARVLKRVRAERAQLQEANERLAAQLRQAQGTAPPAPGAARKRVLELIRSVHPDKGDNHALNRTQLTQQLNDLLPLL